MGGTGDVVRRTAGRVVVLDAAGRVLLQQGVDPSDPGGPRWWMTPGGGVEPGETTAAAALREVWEETGLRLGTLGPAVRHRTVRFPLGGREYEQSEDFFVARLTEREVSVAPRRQTSVELASVLALRWWTPEELRTTTATVYPDWLADLVTSLTTDAATS